MRSGRNIARWTRPIARVAVMMLVLVFAAGQIAGFAHLALVRHNRCADHGELIHVPGAPRGGARSIDGTVTAAQGGAAGPLLAEAASAHDGHRHEHCAAAPQRRDQNRAAGQELPVAIALLKTAPVQPRSTLALPSQDLYRLAPKTSPPA